LRERRLRYEQGTCDPELALRADPEKVRQIILNLLSNAVKFTESGGTITLSSKQSGNCIEIRVADTGPGIAAEKIDRIFDPFVQVDRRLSQPVQGVGLGLAISQDLAHGMNGEITVESVVGKGTTFTLSLPRAPRMDPADVPRMELADMPPTALTDRPPVELADRPPVELADRPPNERPDTQRPKNRADEDQREYHEV